MGVRVEHVLKYLWKAERKEVDPWIRENYRLAWLTVDHAQQDPTDAFRRAFQVVYRTTQERALADREMRWRAMWGLEPEQLTLGLTPLEPVALSSPVATFISAQLSLDFTSSAASKKSLIAKNQIPSTTPLAADVPPKKPSASVPALACAKKAGVA